MSTPKLDLPAIGYRIWRTHSFAEPQEKEPALWPDTCRSWGPWRSGLNVAGCQLQKLGVKPKHLIPSQECLCGFHAYRRLPVMWPFASLEANSNIIYGAALLCGRPMLVGQNVIRAAEAVPLILLDSPMARRLAEMYELPTAPDMGTVRAFAMEYGEEIGDEHVPADA